MSDYLAADDGCFVDAPVRVVGWLEHVRDDEVAIFAAHDAVRSNLANTDSVRSIFFNPMWNLPPAAWSFQPAQWGEVRLQRDRSHAHCGWQLAGLDPPTQICFALAFASAVAVIAPPAAALAACPPTDQPMIVDLFSILPAACFGSAKVSLTGWLGIADSPGGPLGWYLEPRWLWSEGFGARVWLSPDSNALNPRRLRLFFTPASGPAGVPVDRWVTLTGHLSDPAAASCRWVYAGGYDPATGLWGSKPDDASARAACATSFVVDAIGDGHP